MGYTMSEWHVQPRPYTDPETGTEYTLYEVMCPHPNSMYPHYRVACYSDEKAAQEHARTHRRPHGYG